MNFKYLLPLAVAASMVACSDDDSPTVAPAPVAYSSSSDAGIPLSSAGALLPASSDAGIPASSDAGVPASSAGALAPASAASGEVLDENGKLVTRDPNKKYTFYGAELTGLDQFKYGRFEARMKMVAVDGSVSSMFLYYDNSYLGKGEIWNEIDIEILGNKPNIFQANIITGTLEKKVTSETKPELGYDVREDFHLYGMVWTPDYVAWEIDSVEVRRDSIGLEKGQVEYLTKEQSLRFNLWAAKSAAWVGKFTGAGLPAEQYIDYVRTYSYNETTKGFDLLWQDDFEGTTLDPKRWSRGNWEMELVEYRAQNIKVVDGCAKLILNYEAY